MKKIFYFGSLALVFALGLPFLLPVTGVAAESEAEKLAIIGKLTAKILENNHYRRAEAGPALSAQVFDEYLRLLDPGKTFLTAEDIAPFNIHRTTLLNELGSGAPECIFAIHRRYIERLGEYRKYAEAALAKGFQFNIDENYRPDRKDDPFCRNDAELHELWRKKLKNDLLYFRLLRKVTDEARAKLPPAERAKAATSWDRKSPEEKVRTRLHDIYNYASQSDRMDVFGIFLTALAQSYGPHSRYSTPKEGEDFDIQFKLSLSGIGATLTSEDGYTKIVDLVPDGPADKDGRLKVEDRIIAVAQENGEPVDIIDMTVSNVVKLVRGPEGSKVTLTVLPAAGGATAMPINLTLRRAKVELKENAAQGRIEKVAAPDGAVKKIGVIELNNFYMDFDGAAKGLTDYRSSSRDVRKLLEEFKTAAVDAVLLDLRANSGGAFVEAVSMSGLFIKSGPVVQVIDSKRRVEVHNDPDPEIVYDGPLVLLTSKLSASSTEILAGAIKDYRRGLLVGDSRTFGKGTVLGVMELKRPLFFANRHFEAGSVTFETAMFYRVNGESNQQRGVESDIVLPSYTESMELGELFYPNHLPWDKTRPAAFQPFGAALDATVAKLKADSDRRFAANPELLKYREDTLRFKKLRENKAVSLNESRRLKEYYEEQNGEDMTEALLAEKKKNKKERDLLLKEALSITAEYAVLQPRKAADNGR